MWMRTKSRSLFRSLPTRGGWIEIKIALCSIEALSSPSPHGEGGLKFKKTSLAIQADSSLPTRGGWIEISTRLNQRKGYDWSLPTRGGWIEIKSLVKSPSTANGPSPHGEGGLKFASRLRGA